MKSSHKIILFTIIFIIWLILDQWTKSFFDNVEIGTIVGSALGGLVNIQFVCNTGAAWGIFSGNTVVLGVFSIIVIIAIIIYFIYAIKSVNVIQTIAFALIVAGGIGNVIDRFTQGYVTDFIAVTFIDFPIFNIADIGVTCGVVLFFIGSVINWKCDNNILD